MKKFATWTFVGLIVSFLFFSLLDSACNGKRHGHEAAKEPEKRTEAKAPETKTTEAKTAKPRSKRPKAEKPERKLSIGSEAIERTLALAPTGETARTKVVVAVGEAAKAEERLHEAKEAARFEEVEKTLSVDELSQKSAELTEAQEEQQQLAGRITVVKGYVRHDQNFRDSYKSRLINNPSENPAIQLHFRQLAQEKADELQKDMLELQRLEKTFRETCMRVSKLTEEIEEGVGTTHKFSPRSRR